MSTQLSGTPGKKPIDSMPFDRASMANLTPDERSAIYLNQIRKMLIFFVVLAVVGLIAGVILAVVDINAVHAAQQTVGVGGGF
jgi:hypothetical protein